MAGASINALLRRPKEADAQAALVRFLRQAWARAAPSLQMTCLPYNAASCIEQNKKTSRVAKGPVQTLLSILEVSRSAPFSYSRQHIWPRCCETKFARLAIAAAAMASHNGRSTSNLSNARLFNGGVPITQTDGSNPPGQPSSNFANDQTVFASSWASKVCSFARAAFAVAGSTGPGWSTAVAKARALDGLGFTWADEVIS